MTKAQAITKARKIRALVLGAGTAEESASAARKYHTFLSAYSLKDSDIVEPVAASGGNGNGNGKAAHRPGSVRRPTVSAESEFDPFVDVFKRAAGAFVIQLERDLQRWAKAEGLLG